MLFLVLLLFLLFLPRDTGAVITGANTGAGGDGVSGCIQSNPPNPSSGFNPSASTQIMMCVTMEGTPAPINAPTVTATNGVTMTQVATVLSADGLFRTSLFTGVGTGVAGTTVSLIPAADMPTNSNCTYALATFQGQDAATPLRQTNTGVSAAGATGIAVPFSTGFGDVVNNAAYACFGTSTTSAMTIEAGFTQFASSTGCCASRAMHGWKMGEVASASETGAAGYHIGIIAELQVATVAAGGRRRFAPRHQSSLVDYFLAHFSVPAYPGRAYVGLKQDRRMYETLRALCGRTGASAVIARGGRTTRFSDTDYKPGHDLVEARRHQY